MATAPIAVTMLLQGQSSEDQIGHQRAFEGLVADGTLRSFRSFPYSGVTGAAEWTSLWSEVTVHMVDSGSEVLLLQYFHSPSIPDPRAHLDAVRRLGHRPLIATSCGDGFGSRGNEPPRSLLQAAGRSDVTFVTAMGRLERLLARAGAQRITLMPNSACDVRFGAAPPPPPFDAREFDVTFIGSRYGHRDPTHHLYWAARRRQRWVQRLGRRYGTRFGLFGEGWSGLESWQGPVDFDQQVLTAQRGRVVFGGYPGSRCDYYTSNRVFIQMLSGVPLVDYRVPRVSDLLADGTEWLLFDDLDQAIGQIDMILDGELDGDAIGAAGAAAVRSRHLDSHRVRLMVEVCSGLVDARNRGVQPVKPGLDFFRDGIEESSAAAALSNW